MSSDFGHVWTAEELKNRWFRIKLTASINAGANPIWVDEVSAGLTYYLCGCD